MIRAVMFDLGNVVVDVNESKLFKELAEKSDKNQGHIKRAWEKSKARKSFEKGQLSSFEFYQKFCSDIGARINYDEFKSIYCHIFTLNKNVEKLIHKLKDEGYKLVLISNTDALHFHYLETHFKIVKQFDELALSYKLGVRKPNPRIYFKAIKMANESASDCAYFDDISEFVWTARLLRVKAFKFTGYDKMIKNLRKLKVTGL